MNDDLPENRGRGIPSGRLSRLGVFGKIAGGVAGNVVAEGARRLANGERPQMSELLLTPANITRVTDQLSHLRGAAMKLGQMISMDAGDMLPAELSAILGRLRDRAHHMPPQQLQQVLIRHWGKDWRRRFARFGATPIAAASIGQVHKAETHDGRTLAIKVQYPGVRASIDSDVDNVATLLRMTGMMPKEIDIAPLLAEAKRQLHEEADYTREGQQMQRFAALLADDPDFVVPVLDTEFTSGEVLAMSFVAGTAIENLVESPQEERNRVITALIRLVLRELFDFGLMQTDPNFANYRWQAETGRIVLLDFGAARAVPSQTVEAYRRLMRAGLAHDRQAVLTALMEVGFISTATLRRHRHAIDDMVERTLGHAGKPGLFDFADRSFAGPLLQQSETIVADRGAWHVPPADTLFVQRKISGTALLAIRMQARIPLRDMVATVLNARKRGTHEPSD